MGMFKVAAWTAGVWLLAAGAASADVHLAISDGRVSLVAKDATVRQILAEWARIGQTRIVNGDRVPGGPVTLELQGVPEAQALDTILRSVSGYMAAPRVNPIANASQFDRIIVMPTTAAAAAPPVRTAGQSPAPMFPQPVPQPGQPQFQPPPFQPMPPPIPAGDEPPDEERPGPRGPFFNNFPPPQVTGQQPAQTPGVVPTQTPLSLPLPGTTGQNPTTPYGGATPGVIVQPPQQPNQPVIPGQPRRPGGPGGPGSNDR